MSWIINACVPGTRQPFIISGTGLSHHVKDCGTPERIKITNFNASKLLRPGAILDFRYRYAYHGSHRAVLGHVIVIQFRLVNNVRCKQVPGNRLMMKTRIHFGTTDNPCRDGSEMSNRNPRRTLG